jgi:hypothetical protein
VFFFFFETREENNIKKQNCRTLLNITDQIQKSYTEKKNEVDRSFSNGKANNKNGGRKGGGGCVTKASCCRLVTILLFLGGGEDEGIGGRREGACMPVKLCPAPTFASTIIAVLRETRHHRRQPEPLRVKAPNVSFASFLPLPPLLSSLPLPRNPLLHFSFWSRKSNQKKKGQNKKKEGKRW